jgi:hypothetical protein
MKGEGRQTFPLFLLRICALPSLPQYSKAAPFLVFLQMTQEQIKEQLSRNYIELLINSGGYKQITPVLDHGVDLYIMRVQRIGRGDKTRFFDSTDQIGIQLKCTCLASIEEGIDYIKYDLEVKSHNDLVDRIRYKATIPLFLVLVILPDDINKWVTVRDEEIALAKYAYWYRPNLTDNFTPNKNRQRITIPKANKIDLDFINKQFINLF